MTAQARRQRNAQHGRSASIVGLPFTGRQVEIDAHLVQHGKGVDGTRQQPGWRLGHEPGQAQFQCVGGAVDPLHGQRQFRAVRGLQVQAQLRLNRFLEQGGYLAGVVDFEVFGGCVGHSATDGSQGMYRSAGSV